MENRITFVNQHNFDDGVHGNVYFVRAHAISAAVCRFVVTVAERLGGYIVDLRKHGRRRRGIRNFVDQTYDVVSTAGSN